MMLGFFRFLRRFRNEGLTFGAARVNIVRMIDVKLDKNKVIDAKQTIIYMLVCRKKFISWHGSLIVGVGLWKIKIARQYS
jgi:hypothetical protein